MPGARRQRGEEWVVAPVMWKLQLGLAVLFFLVFVLELVGGSESSFWTFGRLGFAIAFLIFARQSYLQRRR